MGTVALKRRPTVHCGDFYRPTRSMAAVESCKDFSIGYANRMANGWQLEVYNFSDFNKQIDASITARKPPGPENVRTS